MRVNEVWVLKKVGDNYVIIPENEPHCSVKFGDKVCNGLLILHDFACFYHTPTNIRHCDIHMKCSRCGKYHTFGISVSEEVFNLLRRSSFHGRIFKEEELKQIYGSLPSNIIERLKSWGYW